MAKVLVVDDELDSCEFVSKFLERQGHTTHCVLNGRQALKQLLNDSPDAVVLDVRMPEMDGISLLEVMRSYLRWTSLPVILVTAQATPQELQRAKALGVCCVFQKASFKLVDLQECLNRVLPPNVRSNGA